MADKFIIPPSKTVQSVVDLQDWNLQGNYEQIELIRDILNRADTRCRCFLHKIAKPKENDNGG